MSPRDIAASFRKISNGVDRASFLARACEGNAELRRQVEMFLAGGPEGETLKLNPLREETWKCIERYFDELRELFPEAQRRRLDEITDREVRDEVESLLAHAGFSDTLDGVVGAMAALVAKDGEEGEQIGVLSCCGNLAGRQRNPVRQDVAKLAP